MEPREWLLLLLSTEPLSADGPEELDPIRIQKAMFLLSQRGPARGLYAFRPYNWGPFSRAVYDDLDSLQEQGLLEARSVPGRSWRMFRTTAAGDERAAQIARRLEPQHIEWLARTREFVTQRSFVRLLHDIYREYPQYSGRSLLR